MLNNKNRGVNEKYQKDTYNLCVVSIYNDNKRFHWNLFFFKEFSQPIKKFILGNINDITVTPTAEELKYFTIGSYEDLKSFESEVNSGKSFDGWAVYMTNNVNCNGNGVAIADNDKGTYFQGYFDGRGHTISNFSPTGYAGGYSNNADSPRAYGLFVQQWTLQ